MGMLFLLELLIFIQGTDSQIDIFPDTNISVTEGDNLNITCQLNNSRWETVEINKGVEALMIFSKNDSKCVHNKPKNPNYTVSCNATIPAFNLHLINITRTHNGEEYKCKMSNNNGTEVLSNKTTIHVNYGPEISLETQIEVEEGQDLVVTCNVTANPVPKIRWKTVTNSEISNCSYDKSCLLTLNKIHRWQKGVYSCYVETRGEVFQKNITVDVQYGPNDTIRLVNSSMMTSKEGERVTLTCEADCNPHCEYKWFDGSTERSNTSDLVIQQIRKNDTGPFECEAMNKIGNSSLTSKINVLYAASIVSIGNNTSVRNETYDNQLQNTTVKCSADGNPRPNITWLKDGTVIKDEENTSISVLTVSSNCVHTGNYTCTVDNGIGSNNSKVVELLIDCKPRIIKETKSKMKHGYAIDVYFHAYPVPNVSWYLEMGQESKLLSGNITIMPHNIFAYVSRLQLDKTIYGQYKIEIINIFGMDSMNITIEDMSHESFNMSIVCAAATLFLVLSILSVLCLIRWKWNTKAAQAVNRRKKKCDQQRTAKPTYDGSYRDNSLYVPCSPEFVKSLNQIQMDKDSNKNISQENELLSSDHLDAKDNQYVDGLYRDNSLYKSCENRQSACMEYRYVYITESNTDQSHKTAENTKRYDYSYAIVHDDLTFCNDHAMKKQKTNYIKEHSAYSAVEKISKDTGEQNGCESNSAADECDKDMSQLQPNYKAKRNRKKNQAGIPQLNDQWQLGVDDNDEAIIPPPVPRKTYMSFQLVRD